MLGWVVVDVGQSLVSCHLGELRKAGLVTSAAAGRANKYRLSNPDRDKLALLIGGLEGQRPPGLGR